MGAARDPTQGKLGPNWEGPYRITLVKEGHLPPRDDRRAKAATSMEHRALAKVLPIKRMT